MSRNYVAMPTIRPRNAMIDFSPVAGALDSWRDQTNTNTRNAMMREQRAQQQAQQEFERGLQLQREQRAADEFKYNVGRRPQQEELERLRLQNERMGLSTRQMQIDAMRDERAQMAELQRMFTGGQPDQAVAPQDSQPQAGVGRFAAPQMAPAPQEQDGDRVRIGNRMMTRSEATSLGEAMLLNPKTKAAGTAILKRLDAGGGSMGFGEKQVDKEFAKDYNELIAQGGFADMRKNLKQLRLVQQELDEGKKNLTGPVLGLMPDAITSFTNPDAVDRRELVEEVVQRNLRLILGAQFTQKEGDRLIARAYNPRLDEKTNAARVGRLIDAMEQAMQAKMAAAEYFEKNGTLKGYKGRQQFNVDEILGSAGLNEVGDHGLQPGDVQDGYRFKGGNPADKSNWEKI